MKKHTLNSFGRTIMLCMASMFALAVYGQNAPLKVATYNLRIAIPDDKDERNWENRKHQVVKLIKKYDFDILGVEEVLDEKQMNDLTTGLPGYDYYIKGRDNTQGTTGERAGVLFKKKLFQMTDSGFFFLSETPDSVSFGWDAACRRICTWVKLTDRNTQQTFYIFSSHFDHMGVNARVQSAYLVLSKIKKIAGQNPVFFMGDLNTAPGESEMYNILSYELDDSQKISKKGEKKNVATYNGYNMKMKELSEVDHIDYIFCKKFDVSFYKVITDKYSKHTYPSDHFPVFIICRYQ